MTEARGSTRTERAVVRTLSHKEEDLALSHYVLDNPKTPISARNI